MVLDGAAEEAGLQVGDYVMAVNGTDVTSVPHSEAADLARQGKSVTHKHPVLRLPTSFNFVSTSLTTYNVTYFIHS